MDILLITIAVIFLLLGIVGCLLPMLPGPPPILCSIDLIAVHFTFAIF
jgi:uncharacterized protein